MSYLRIQINTKWIMYLCFVASGCATTHKAHIDEVRIVHLTTPVHAQNIDKKDNQTTQNQQHNPNANLEPLLYDPAISGNTIVGKATLDTNPIARIETPDGYAPQTQSDFTQAPEESTLTPSITVKDGDTVYSIARQNDTTVTAIASINQLDSAFTIRPGQILVLPKAASTENIQNDAINTQQQNTPNQSNPAPPAAEPTTTTSANIATDLATRRQGDITWSWPVRGTARVLRAFSDPSSGESIKGIDIAGEINNPVYASANGTVVYAGSELKGYGKLIIMSHPNGFMSAYAHNSQLLVEADQEIQRGQHIADFGNTESKRVKLFFQIRKNGEPVDPIAYLPKR